MAHLSSLISKHSYLILAATQAQEGEEVREGQGDKDARKEGARIIGKWNLIEEIYIILDSSNNIFEENYG